MASLKEAAASIFLMATFLVGVLGEAQQYAAPQPPWAYNWNGGYGGRYPTRQMHQYQQPPMQGTVWRSNWFPAKNLNLATQQSGSARLPPRSSSMKFSDTDYRHYVNRFMPGFNEAAYQFNNGYPQQPPPGYYQQRPPYYNGNGYQNGGRPPYQNGYGGRPPWGNGYNGRPPYPPYEDPRTFPEAVATCNRMYCYYSCRLRLLGGGRCTKGGCMCYPGFFDFDGSPTSNYFPEDSIWYELPEVQRQQIRAAMVRHTDTLVPATPKPRPPQPPVTNRPPYNNNNNNNNVWRPTNRPPYNRNGNQNDNINLDYDDFGQDSGFDSFGNGNGNGNSGGSSGFSNGNSGSNGFSNGNSGSSGFSNGNSGSNGFSNGGSNGFSTGTSGFGESDNGGSGFDSGFGDDEDDGGFGGFGSDDEDDDFFG